MSSFKLQSHHRDLLKGDPVGSPFVFLKAFKMLPLIVLTSSLVMAKPVSSALSSSQESVSNIIEKANNLSLQKDRLQALQILNNALLRGKLSSTGVIEIKTAASELARIFYSEKSQQLYELGLSMRLSNPSQGMVKLQEALRIEPENLQIQLEIARLQMGKGDCSGAKDLLSKYRKILPNDEELGFSLAQAAICDSDFKEYNQVRNQFQSTKSPISRHWSLLSYEYALKQDGGSSIRSNLESFLKEKNVNPEALYLKVKIDKELKKSARQEAQNYLNICKNLSHSLFRQYMIDAFLCRHINEVEALMKTMNVNPE